MRKLSLFETLGLLLLVALLAVLYLVVTTTPQSVTGWNFQGTGRVQYMTVGDNDSLYAFKSDEIYALDSAGNLAWDFHVPQQWKTLNTWERPVYAEGTTGVSRTVESYPVSDAANGSLYVFVLPNVTADSLKLKVYQDMSPYIALDSAVLAISPDGKLAWELPVTVMVPSADVLKIDDMSQLVMTRPVALQASGDRVYVFHDYTETVVGSDGKVLFELRNVSRPAAVDEAGHIFIVRAEKPTQAYINSLQPGEDTISLESDPDALVPSSTVEGYDRSGQQLWSRDVHENVAPQYVSEDIWPEFNTLPLYKNGTLYVPLKNSIIAMDSLDAIKWWRSFPGSNPYVMFDLMPVDDQGNVYMKTFSKTSSSYSSYITVISPDGLTYYAPWVYTSQYDTLRHTAASDGIVYGIDRTSFGTLKSLKDLQTLTLTAYDVKNSSALWSSTLPLQRSTEVVLNSSNVADVLKGVDASYPTSSYYALSGKAFTPVGWPEISIYPGDSLVYVSFRSTNYDAPLVLNKSHAAYSSGIYALDSGGKLVWQKALSEPVTSAAANNSTIYYATTSGQIFSNRVNIVVFGLAALAAGLVLFKFAGLGTVTRARARLNQNDNRNAVHQYILANPGCTAVDIGRDMSLNVGTIRYHLLILAINHKIVEHKDDKYLRYFTNSNTYSLAERTVISLMKREPMWRVLSELAEKPGLSNVEISRLLNISTGASSRHMNELFQKGIVTKTPQGDRGFAYAIKDEYKVYVQKMLERL